MFAKLYNAVLTCIYLIMYEFMNHYVNLHVNFLVISILIKLFIFFSNIFINGPSPNPGNAIGKMGKLASKLCLTTNKIIVTHERKK